MNESEELSKNAKPNISRLIAISFTTGILGICILLIRANFYRPWWSEYVARNLELLFGIIGVIAGYWAVKRIYRKKTYFTLGVIILFLFFQMLLNFIISPYSDSFLWGCIEWASIACILCLLLYPAVNIMNRWVYGVKGSFKHDLFSYSGIAIGLFLCGIWLGETSGPIQTAFGMGCSLNLQKLGEAISTYSNENQNQYPAPNHWCDLILKSGNIKKDDFICPEVKFRWKRQLLPFPIPINRKSYYAINPDCEPNSPQDTVLLFEIDGGWNKFGGPEILTTQNHSGEGCNILFNGDYIQFISTKQIAGLKWE